MFSVVPVNSSIRSTPQITAGTVETTAIERRNDWKFAARSKKTTTTVKKQASTQTRARLLKRWNLSTVKNHHSAGWRPGPLNHPPNLLQAFPLTFPTHFSRTSHHPRPF